MIRRISSPTKTHPQTLVISRCEKRTSGNCQAALKRACRCGSCHEMSPEIEHRWTRQQQGDKTGKAKRASKQGFADQQQTRGSAEEQGNALSGDPQQNHDRNRIYLTSARQIEDALSQWESGGNHQGVQLRGREVALGKLIEKYRDDCATRCVAYRPTRKQPAGYRTWGRSGASWWMRRQSKAIV